MNLNKLQRYFLTRLLKGEYVGYEPAENGATLLSNGYCIFVVPNSALMLDTAKMIMAELSVIIDKNKGGERLTQTMECRLGCKSQHYVLYTGDTVRAWLDEEYLMWFDGCDFYGANERNPVIIYDSGDLVGTICPVRCDNKKSAPVGADTDRAD